MTVDSTNRPRWLILFTLIFAGEMIFSLPFHVIRFFRPTFLEVFQISNTQLGDVFAVYGIIAMIAYFPGGPLADRFSARRLLALSLFLTGLGGFYFARLPGITGLSILFGCWGFTTIFLLWAGMIKATREWGGTLRQGTAFGVLDGGRGLVAAGVASSAVFVLRQSITGDPDAIDPAERIRALQYVIYLYTGLTLAVSILVLLVIPEDKRRIKPPTQELFKGIRQALGNRAIWLQALIVVCAYCGYKGIDFYALYANQVLGMNEVESAAFVSNASYLRIAGAIGAGLIVDRLSATRVISYTFLIAIVAYWFLSFITIPVGGYFLITANLLVSFLAVYGLRGVYFAMLEETKVSGNITGTAVGIISVIGYAPDVFIYSITGRMIDANPGIEGFHNFFLLLGFISLIGMAATTVLARSGKMIKG